MGNTLNMIKDITNTLLVLYVDKIYSGKCSNILQNKMDCVKILVEKN